ncbi:NAD/fad-dependent oxidoreductase [Halogeometricum borinquense DSM 11551]|uniref:NAD/fad-dependent oxidoreductase n=1 Tax=Halogeometricum borinquense (strain ATCC 700274 / DSM 11551 / JCM 10706 / KCTC 4070 / PR3) TaxID=469382 RepID=E4NN37_HALBP|nr:FAD-dependent oxidoreductase [Halogeometricum borinquense]ADQ66267.1 predicted NAD/FAD-dependent oxidoreductase [Halogeometricum borinquense DSM 11551]ELY27237.1 NAD/fad-dependent oxidoreductase [Halogeometricum borinquense DSM 11551]
MTLRVGIVGAGAAGVGAAYALRNADAEVTIVEKSRGVCGRAATRRKHDCYYDHGANYIKESDQRTESLIRDLGTDGVVDIEKPVWVFDESGEITEGDDGDSHKWTWTEGITQLAKRLLARTDAEVRRETRVESIVCDDSEATWSLIDTEGETHGPFDRLLLTPPAPQTAEILRATEWDGERLGDATAAVSDVSYRTIRTFVLHYPFREEYSWYGLVNVDKAHEVGWVSREECKDGHVPDGESLLIAQMSPEWSAERYDDPLAEAGDDAAALVAELLDDDRYADPDWVDDQGWRYALPNDGVDTDAVRATEDAGLFFAGDWVVGEGRVHHALWNGHEAAERIVGRAE